MAQTFDFPDIEELLCTYMETPLGAPVGSRADPGQEYVRLIRTGGSATRVTDTPQVTVEAYGKTETSALELLGRARRLLFDLPGTSLQGWAVKSVTHVGGPVNLPDPLSSSSRYTSTVAVQIRGKQTL